MDDVRKMLEQKHKVGNHLILRQNLNKYLNHREVVEPLMEKLPNYFEKSFYYFKSAVHIIPFLILTGIGVEINCELRQTFWCTCTLLQSHVPHLGC